MVVFFAANKTIAPSDLAQKNYAASKPLFLKVAGGLVL